jgi:alkylhydroperoxidase family enzyme
VQAARHGATEEQLEKLLEFEEGPFSEAERAALAFAKQITGGSLDVSEELLARLRSHYNEGEIVEITAMAGFFNYLNRVANSLEIEPTKPGEGL